MRSDPCSFPSIAGMHLLLFVVSVLVLFQVETTKGSGLRGDDDVPPSLRGKEYTTGRMTDRRRISSFGRNTTVFREYGRYKRPAAPPAGQMTCAVCAIPHWC